MNIPNQSEILVPLLPNGDSVPTYEEEDEMNAQWEEDGTEEYYSED